MCCIHFLILISYMKSRNYFKNFHKLFKKISIHLILQMVNIASIPLMLTKLLQYKL